jgi:nucleoside-diphosphate-sugar epimerase
MRVLVTGADGFLGRYLVGDLPGHTVICASRRPMQGVDWRPLPDLGGNVDWAPLLQGVDAVVHLANIAHQQASGMTSGVSIKGRRRRCAPRRRRPASGSSSMYRRSMRR